MQLKYPDTFLLIVSGVAYLVVGYGLWFWIGDAAFIPMLAVFLLAIFALQLHQFRVRERQDAYQLRQIQALLSLYHLVSFKSLPPWFTGWAATPELAATIYRIVREERPRSVVELGSGASTVVIAAALEQNGTGHVTSIDQDAEYAERTRESLRREGLSERADVVHAPIRTMEVEGSSRLWYDRSALPGDDSIDMLIIDGPNHELQKMARYPALPIFFNRLSEHAVIVLDDADRRDERRAVRAWQERFDGLSVEYVDSPKGTAILRRGS